MGAIANDEMITAKDGQQHSWKSIKLLIATLIVSTLGDGFCGVMMAVALPNISETYHVSIATANWVTVGYAIVAATAVMTSLPLLWSCCPRAMAAGTVITARWVMEALCTSSRSITWP